MWMTHKSNSATQREAEIAIIDSLSQTMGVPLTPTVVEVGPEDSIRLQIDGVSDDGRVLAEAFARQGRLKAGQKQKVAKDVLKLVTVARSRPDAELVLAVADQIVADQLKASNWLSWAIREWAIKVVVVELGADQLSAIRSAQSDQRR